MTVDELLAQMGRRMTERWLEEIRWDKDTLAGFLAHGIPADYAAVLRDLFGLPFETWPKLIHPPRLRSHVGKRSMLGSKMELQNAGAKSKRVRIAASMTDHETEAKKALLAANVTPQEVAEELGVGRSTVNAWCNGTRSIPVAYRDALAKAKGARKPIRPGVWKKIGG